MMMVILMEYLVSGQFASAVSFLILFCGWLFICGDFVMCFLDAMVALVIVVPVLILLVAFTATLCYIL